MKTTTLENIHAQIGELIEQIQPIDGYDFTTEVPNVSTSEMLAVVTLHAEKSFTKAAETIGMSQPGLSRMIQRVEAATQRKLFSRTGKGAHVTVQGAEIVVWCMDTLNALRAIGVTQ